MKKPIPSFVDGRPFGLPSHLHQLILGHYASHKCCLTDRSSWGEVRRFIAAFVQWKDAIWMDAKRFFEVALPQMLINHLETFLVTRGTMAFSVQDAGEWTLCWGDIETPITAGFRPDAETKVWLSASAWQGWSAGDLDPSAAVLSGEIVVDGNEDMLETLGYFLRPTNTLLDVYLQQGS